MRRTRSALFLAPALTLGLLSGVRAQSPNPAPAPATTTAPATAAGRSVPAPVDTRAKPAAPVKLLEKPQPTPVMPRPALPGAMPVGAPASSAPAAPGNAPAGTAAALRGVPGTDAAAPALGNLPVGATTDLRGTAGPAPLSNMPPGVRGEPLPEAPGTVPQSETGGAAPDPDVVTTPMFAHTAEVEPALPPTPVPVLQLSILYGVILLCAGGYFWYTARLPLADDERASR